MRRENASRADRPRNMIISAARYGLTKVDIPTPFGCGTAARDLQVSCAEAANFALAIAPRHTKLLSRLSVLATWRLVSGSR